MTGLDAIFTWGSTLNTRKPTGWIIATLKKTKEKCFVADAILFQPHSLLNHFCDQTPVRSSAPPQFFSSLLSDGMEETRIGRAKVKKNLMGCDKDSITGKAKAVHTNKASKE